jgi:nucleoside transporter
MADRFAAVATLQSRSSTATMVRMSAMMFLQYWPLGIWGVTVGTFIAANTGDEGSGTFSAGFVGYSTAAGAIGSLVSPVFVGFLSDRYFTAQRLLALMHVGCALAAWGMYYSQTQGAFFVALLAYFQFFSPAAALTNKIALRHLANADREYPRIRIFSTLGWISAGLFLGYAWPRVTGETIEATRVPLMLGAGGSLLMVVYSLTLPNTPPEGRREEFMLRALRDSRELLRNRPLVAFLFLSMLACVPSMAYNNYGNLFLNNQGYHRPAALMTLGQLSDVLFLWATPWFIARFGLRTVFLSGVIAWAIRYSLLALGSYSALTWPVYLAIVIHGACYVFVYVVGVMFVDRLVERAHRGTAQGLYALTSSGLGHLIGAVVVGVSQATFLTPEKVSPPPYDWTSFWVVPAIVSAVVAVAFSVISRHQLKHWTDSQENT